MQTILLVGERNNVVTNFAEKLRPFGVQEIVHLDDVKQIRSVPEGVEAIVVVHNNSNPVLIEAAKELAKARQLPIASVRHQWARALPVLRASGLLPPAERGQDELRICPVDLKTIALDYITAQRVKGRAPKFGEVESVLQKAFGPSYSLTMGLYKEFSHRAAAIQPMSAVPETPPAPVGSTAHAIQWGQLILEERPELVHDPDLLYKEIRDLIEDDDGEGGYLPGNWPPKHSAVSAIKAQTELWKTDRKAKIQALDRWTKRQIRVEFDTNGTVPTYRDLISRSKDIFGTSVSGKRLPQLRGDVLGAWAVGKLIQTPQAYEFYVSLASAHGFPPIDLEAFTLLLSTTLIKRVVSKHPKREWETTEEAVSDYVVPMTKAAPVQAAVDVPAAIDAPAPVPANPLNGDASKFRESLDNLAAGTKALRESIVLLKEGDDSDLRMLLQAIEGLRTELQQFVSNQPKVMEAADLLPILSELGNNLEAEFTDSRQQVELLGDAVRSNFRATQSSIEAAKQPPIEQTISQLKTEWTQVAHLSVNKLTLSEGARLVLDPSARIHVDEMTVEAGAIIELANLA